MGKLWEKKGLSLDKAIERFEVGKDYLYDEKLAPYDVLGNVAHAKMLSKIKIITKEEFDQLKKGLREIWNLIEKKNFKLNIEDEDIHTKVENFLVEKLGDVGKKIHTGRSRNDQVLVDLRLFTKHNILELTEDIFKFIEVLLEFSEDYEFIPIPGYTHMQLAMPSSIGMWASSFIENMLDVFKLLKAVYDWNDMNPLGSGAGYGVSLPIDREYTTTLLGFSRTQINSQYCGNSRGQIEAAILGVLSHFAIVLNRMATDILLFTTKEFQFFTFSERVSTGSSIMPQKKNLDVMELIRGKTHLLLSYELGCKQLITNLPSGYNRDYQEAKPYLMDGLDLIRQMFQVAKIVIENMKPNIDQLKKAHKPELYATDAAYRLVENGVPFREAYKRIGTHLDELKNEDQVENIKSKKHIGATGNLLLGKLREKYTELKQKWQDEKQKTEKNWERLWEL